MFISALELFKIGIGPSSSHTLGPIIAAMKFRNRLIDFFVSNKWNSDIYIRCILKGSLAFTGKGHATDRAVVLGLHGFSPIDLAYHNVDRLIEEIWNYRSIKLNNNQTINFSPVKDIVFDKGKPLPEHPNGMIFELVGGSDEILMSETYFSIGGGFINTLKEIKCLVAPLKMESTDLCPYPFDSANTMLKMAGETGLSIADIKRLNEIAYFSEADLNRGLDLIWEAMHTCVKRGITTEGILSGSIKLPRRAKKLHDQLNKSQDKSNLNEWLCTYAMAASEENAACHMVVTAPTNGAAGVIPAVLYYFVNHEGGTIKHIRDFLLTASAIGGIIKHRSSISGAEVGCQGEVGSAASMAAAGLCAVKGGTAQQVEKAAEIALEHHLGLTCDPVNGLVQVPCIERNGFGAVKAYTAASIALLETGKHFMPLDNCISAMKQIGLEMSEKYKETSLGGLAVSLTEC